MIFSEQPINLIYVKEFIFNKELVLNKAFYKATWKGTSLQKFFFKIIEIP